MPDATSMREQSDGHATAGRRRRLLIVVSAPSGAGKTTLCDRLLAELPDIAYSVSCTTRAPRGREIDGQDYVFLSEAEFAVRAAHGLFLEHAVVHGNRYGTLKAAVRTALAAGRSVLMDIDVQGAAQIRNYIATLPPDDDLRRGFVDIFVEPPSLETLRRRLERRAEDAPAEIERRLRQAEVEMAQRGAYRLRIVNDDIDRAYAEFRACILREMARA